MRVHVLLEGYWHHFSPDDLGLDGCAGYGTLRSHIARRLGIDMTRLNRHEIEPSLDGDLIMRSDDVGSQKTPERASGLNHQFTAPLIWLLGWRKRSPRSAQTRTAGTPQPYGRQFPSSIHAPPVTKAAPTPSRITGR